MCNRYRLSAKQAAVMRACGFEPPYREDEIRSDIVYDKSIYLGLLTEERGHTL